ncbi:hypothetical protein I3760_08G088100 [Carya illinoinensis]|nr:hypothetical protein I3760_08G088100 [Carya illinoinensis]
MDAEVRGCGSAIQVSSDQEGMDIRRGPWTDEEDSMLKNYVTINGEGRWNSVARCTGLKRTGKSCRLRWLNYLRPDVKRGNITLQEQLLILELHSRWGNRWSKIAQYLPGRTDNEIKNYWRTRVQKQAKQLKCDVNSKQFRDAMRYVWMPRLIERIRAMATPKSQCLDGPTNTYCPDLPLNNQTQLIPNQSHALMSSGLAEPYLRPAISSTSSDSSEAQVSSDLTNDLPCGNYIEISQNESGLIQQGLDIQTYDDQHINGWFGGGDTLDSFWDYQDQNMWFL